MTMLKPIAVAMPAGAERELERLRMKVGDLQAENAGLRRRLPESTGDMKRLRQAHRDAGAMLMHRFNGYSISRENCLALGIPRRRWPWAIALLKTARIYDGDITETEFDAAVRRLDAAYNDMENAGTIARLKLRLSPYYTQK